MWDQRGPWLVQARPIVHREDLQSSVDTRIRELIAFSREDSDKLWRLDATHNPLPLSPAQAGLVRQVRDLAPYDMRVVGGHQAVLSVDGAAGTTVDPGHVVVIRRSPYVARFLRRDPPAAFYSTLTQRLGVSGRQVRQTPGE